MPIGNPLFLSRDPLRTAFYENDKKGKATSVSFVYLSPDIKLIDLTSEKDLYSIGLPPELAQSFKEFEPYFSFNVNVAKYQSKANLKDMISPEMGMESKVLHCLPQ